MRRGKGRSSGPPEPDQPGGGPGRVFVRDRPEKQKARETISGNLRGWFNHGLS